MSHRIVAAVATVLLAFGAAHAAPEAWPEMVLIPAETFEMGSLPGESGREGDEGPRHTVTLARPLRVSRTEVTQAQWMGCVVDRACVSARVTLGDDYPVTDVRWSEAQAYVSWLSAKTHRHYRLLTEAEWEYAARAGNQLPYPNGDTIDAMQANFAASGIGQPIPVGRYAPNHFGLQDMAGNVWEWVADCYDESGYYGASSDGGAVTTGSCQMHVLRGGAFDTRPEQMRASYRFRAQFGGANVGLRVAMEDRP